MTRLPAASRQRKTAALSLTTFPPYLHPYLPCPPQNLAVSTAGAVRHADSGNIDPLCQREVGEEEEID